jgi:hypothetical protein
MAAQLVVSEREIQAFWLLGVILKSKIYIEFGVLAAMIMKTSTFWATTACSPLKFNPGLEKNVASIFRNRE